MITSRLHLINPVPTPFVAATTANISALSESTAGPIACLQTRYPSLSPCILWRESIQYPRPPSWQVLQTSKWSVGTHIIFLFSVLPDPLCHRFRPSNAIEAREGGEICVSFDDNLQTVQLRSAAVGSGPEKDGFTFDRVFPMGTKQAEVFDYGVKE